MRAIHSVHLRIRLLIQNHRLSSSRIGRIKPLEADSCHNNRKTGEYHCHGGWCSSGGAGGTQGLHVHRPCLVA
jgi:hypothetical protein